jgi:drug/metabolite transporter (DMT)-like permease
VLSAALALTASIGWGVGDFIGGVKSRVLTPLTVMAVSQPFGLVILAVIALVRGRPPDGPEVAWGCLAAVLGTVGLAGFYRGMAAGAMSIVAPIAAAGAAIPVIWGVAHGDQLHGLQAIGIIAALGGGVVASLERHGERTRIAAGVGWGVFAMLGFGGYFIPLHAAARHDWLWPALVFRATSVALVWTIVLALRRYPRGARPHLIALAACGILDTGGNALFAAASIHGLVSVVSVLASLYPVVTVLLARFLLGERVQPSQNAGVAVALVGVVLITAG